VNFWFVINSPSRLINDFVIFEVPCEGTIEGSECTSAADNRERENMTIVRTAQAALSQPGFTRSQLGSVDGPQPAGPLQLNQQSPHGFQACQLFAKGPGSY